MALINCPECNNQVSDKATACPQCACPIAAQAASAAVSVSKVQTIEATGKKWKGMQLGAAIVLGLSVARGMQAASSDQQVVGLLCAAAGFISLLVFLYARFAAWWHHK